MVKISYSQITLFDECHRKWYYLYVDKIKRDVPDAFKFGGNVHKMIEATLKRKMSGVQQKSFNYSSQPELEFIKAQKLVKNGLKKLTELVGDWHILVNPNNVELKLTNNFFTGIIDLLVQHSTGDYYLIDWKTTSFVYDEHKIKTDKQLTAYAWMCQEKIGFIPEHICFVTLNKKSNDATAYVTERNQNDIDEFEKMARQKHQEILLKPNDRNPNSCKTKWGTCSFYDKCWSKRNVKILQTELPELS